MNADFMRASAGLAEIASWQASMPANWRTIMTKNIVSLGAILAILALPMTAYAQPTGAASGASTEAVAKAPEASTNGAVLTAEQRVKIQQYVGKEKRPSIKVTENVAVGAILPGAVELYPLPAEISGKSDYRYTIVNEHTVLVEAKTHKVTQIIN